MLYCISFSNEIVPVTNYVNIISIKGLNFDNISKLNNDVLVGYYLANSVAYWSLLTVVDLGNRSDTNKANRSPVTTSISFVR